MRRTPLCPLSPRVDWVFAEEPTVRPDPLTRPPRSPDALAPPARPGGRRGGLRNRLAAYAAGAGRSATSRIDTLSSSSWKCGRRNATARYAPGLPGFSIPSMRACECAGFLFTLGDAFALPPTLFDIHVFRNDSASARDMYPPILSRIIAFG